MCTSQAMLPLPLLRDMERPRPAIYTAQRARWRRRRWRYALGLCISGSQLQSPQRCYFPCSPTAMPGIYSLALAWCAQLCRDMQDLVELCAFRVTMLAFLAQGHILHVQAADEVEGSHRSSERGLFLRRAGSTLQLRGHLAV
ncbi:hypothetical protein P280DRAFT_283740 [Massarina eburnea CBS 473.64]|uniref:Uncharacterized protein n=1 Tax=Massarina eburnea CBS 473.64 TaxID=1395130 RepID=A0A6A6S3M8_9PLEO|nr:hypothetical protein P280DRAFT_283740 [Massarina eburnea CBS 473.64]